MRGNWKVPVGLVTAVSGCSSTGPVTVTITPGSTAFDWSVTLPKISPVCDCADAVVTLAAKIATNATTINRTLISCLQQIRARLKRTGNGHYPITNTV